MANSTSARTAARPVAAGTLALSAALVLAGCGTDASEATTPADGYPLTVQNCGEDVSIEAPPERVVMLESAAVTILDGIGVFDRVQARAGAFPLEYYDQDLAGQVAGVEAFSEDIDAAGHLMISAEEVIAQSPDLVLGLPDGVNRAALADAGAPALIPEAYCAEHSEEAQFEDIYAEVSRYGQIFDRSEQAEELNAELAERVAAVAEGNDGEHRTAAVLYPSVGGGPLYAYGTSSMAHPQLEVAGLQNLFADMGERVFEIQTEELIDRDPDVLIVLYQGTQADAEDALAQRSGVDGVSAINDGDVHYQLFNFTEPASPLVVDGLERLAEQVRG